MQPIGIPPYEHVPATLNDSENLSTRLELPGASKSAAMFEERTRKPKSRVNGLLDRCKLLEEAKDMSVVREFFRFVKDKNATRGVVWTDYYIRLTVAALAISQMKPQRAYVVDRSKLTHIFLGDHFPRSQDGHLYFYDEGLGASATANVVDGPVLLRALVT